MPIARLSFGGAFANVLLIAALTPAVAAVLAFIQVDTVERSPRRVEKITILYCRNQWLGTYRRTMRMTWPFTISAKVAGMATAAVLCSTLGASDAMAQTPTIASSTRPVAVQLDVIYQDYKFRDGETLSQLRMHYATIGTPHRDRGGNIDNAILVLHWTGNSGASVMTPDYFRALYDAGRPLDANRYYLIIPDNLGHGKSSKPSDGLRAKFPHYGYNDLVDLQHKLVAETLGVSHLRAILGMSMGGMNAWQWAEAYPNEMDGVMPIVSLPAPVSGRNLLWRRIVIDSIRNDPAWSGGNYTNQPWGYALGFRVLRMMIDGVPRLHATLGNVQETDDFLQAADRVSGAGDANDLMYSLDSSRDYNPLPELRKIKTRVFALNFSDDEFNPDVLGILEEYIPRVKEGSYVVQQGTPSSFGHLTMANPSLWAAHVADFMKSLGENAGPHPSR